MGRPNEFVSDFPSPLSELCTPGSDLDRHRKYFTEGNVKAIRKLVAQLCQKRRAISVQKTDSVHNFQMVGYSEHQAYQSGYRQALSEIENLLTTENK